MVKAYTAEFAGVVVEGQLEPSAVVVTVGDKSVRVSPEDAARLARAFQTAARAAAGYEVMPKRYL